MRVPLSWLQSHVELPTAAAQDLAARLTEAGLKVEHIDRIGEQISGVVVARVVDIEDVIGQKKPIRWVTLDDGTDHRRSSVVPPTSR